MPQVTCGGVVRIGPEPSDVSGVTRPGARKRRCCTWCGSEVLSRHGPGKCVVSGQRRHYGRDDIGLAGRRVNRERPGAAYGVLLDKHVIRVAHPFSLVRMCRSREEIFSTLSARPREARYNNQTAARSARSLRENHLIGPGVIDTLEASIDLISYAGRTVEHAEQARVVRITHLGLIGAEDAYATVTDSQAESFDVR